MMHPEMVRAVMTARVDDFHRGRRPQASAKSVVAPRIRTAAGWFLVEVGLRLAVAPRDLRPATR